MTKELGVWKAEDCALVLIDCQNEMFEVIRSETNADLVELHARMLAKDRQGVRYADRALDRRGGVRLQQADPPLDSGRARRDRADRPHLDERVRGSGLPREAVEATARKRLIIGTRGRACRSGRLSLLV
jgi:hypothetical protein